MTGLPVETDHAKYSAIVRRALATQSGLRPDEIDLRLAILAIPRIESVKVLRAIVEIEDNCAIVIPDDFLFETATVGELIALVLRLVDSP